MSKQLVAEVSMSLLSDFHIEIRGSQSNINCFFLRQKPLAGFRKNGSLQNLINLLENLIFSLKKYCRSQNQKYISAKKSKHDD